MRAGSGGAFTTVPRHPGGKIFRGGRIAGAVRRKGDGRAAPADVFLQGRGKGAYARLRILSIVASSSASNVTLSKHFRESSNWSGLLAPTSTEVTRASLSIQDSAIWASV